MAKERGEKHRYGQHYTPVRVARLLAALAVRSATDTVFDPACGDGRLLEAAQSMKKSLFRAGKQGGMSLAEDIFGLDRAASAVLLASKIGAKVACADFFDIEPGSTLERSFTLPDGFDAIIGNPPYIRQEVIGSVDKRRIEGRLKEGRMRSPEICWPQWSRRSDIYVYFFAQAARFLRTGGRLVYLTASSWLDSRYGGPLRDFMTENFRVIAVMESAVESFFADASINTAITVLERETDATARDTNTVRFITLLRPMDEILNSDSEEAARNLARLIESNTTYKPVGAYKTRIVSQAELRGRAFRFESSPWRAKRESPGETTWSRYLRADDVFFEILERGGDRLKSLSSFAGVRFGVKTGANEFFYVRNANGRKPQSEMLALGSLASVRRGITTGANEFFYLKSAESDINNAHDNINHSIRDSRVRPQRFTLVEDGTGRQHELESEYLAPVIFSLKEITSIMIESDQTRRFFFNCSASPDNLTDSLTAEYIRSGERNGYHERPTCAGRNPWYAVARGMKPAPIIFPAKVGERWIVALNRAGVYEDKKLYGVFPRRNVSEITLAALLNSTWARYYTEVTCRQMTGAQAIADIDVHVAEEILIPDPRRLSSGIKKRLESALMKIARRPVRSIFEEINLPCRRRLDDLTVEAIGFDDKTERRQAIDSLYLAVTELVNNRVARSKK